MSYSRTIKNTLIGIFVVLAIFFYKFCATQFNLPTFLSGQWYALTGFIVSAVSLVSWCLIPIHLALLFEVDKSCRQMRVDLYNALGDKQLSMAWQIVVFIMTAILFQYGYYLVSFGLLGIGFNIMTFRIMHSSIIRKASVQVLKN
jgi:hypothetical protein